MIWVAWRQARTGGYGLLAVTAGFAVLAVLERTQEMAGMTRSLSIYFGLFVGVLLGAPLLAQEFEHGTYRMVWTQGVTRSRWLLGRSVVALTLALAGTAALHTLVTRVAEAGRPAILPSPMDSLATTGLTPYARTIWMALLGLLVGALVRRTVGAVAVTAGGWMATQLLLDVGLPRWLPDGWRHDFWAAQLCTAALLVGLSALALVGTLAVLGLRPGVPGRGYRRSGTSGRRYRIALPALLGAVALTAAFAVPHVSADAAGTANGAEVRARSRFTAVLPAPTGPYPIGTVAWQLAGAGRPDPWRAGRERELTVQLWYPAAPGGAPGAAPPAPWAHPNVARRAAQRYGFAPESLVELRGHAVEAAPVRPDAGRLPVLLFSPGDGGNRTDNSALTEELASHGYLVVAVDHLGDALEGSSPDGQLVPRSKPELPDDIAIEELGGPAVVAQVDVRVADLRAVRDGLARINGAEGLEPAGPVDRVGVRGTVPAGLAGRIDLDRLGVLGHSLGGATAAGAMFADDRIRAGANLDGLVAGPVASEGLDRPFLVLRQPLHTTAIDPSWRTFLPALRGWHRLVTIAGSGHYSFADLGLWTRQAGVDLRTTRKTYRFNFGSGDNGRATVLVRELLVGFFDVHLRDRPVPAVLAGPTPQHPELRFD